MSDFRFAEPEWVHGMWGVLALVGLLLALEFRSTRTLEGFIGRLLHARLVARASRGRRLARVGCLGLAAAALVLAMMRPQFGLSYVTTPKVGAEIYFCLDVSRSMLAEDVVPNRLERAKLEIEQLLPMLDGDQVGLIAFAGRAAILCPLTPDFSFFRLVLDEVSANMVGRGGTRLEEPLRKAVQAFGENEDAAKLIILITDGEDHDSFVKEAAELVKERGIQFMAIGIGDEAGSSIEVTDPNTGATELLRGSDGTPVMSRLDGETLRLIATESEGRYILAGTRALDLEDIYERSIQPLMRSPLESGGRTVRQEAYQWPAMLALLALLAAGLLTGRARPPATLGAALIIALLLPATPLAAQAPQETGSPPSATPAEALLGENAAQDDATRTQPEVTTPTGGSPTVEELETEERPPREIHNDALAAFGAGELDTARTLFERAERESKLDVTLRYRCRYHLGWVHVKEADAIIESDPEGAITALEEAANRFRDAIRARPQGEEARHNLEVVLRRIRELRDSLRQKDARDLATRLDELIGRQRTLLTEVRGLLEAESANPGATPEEPRRRQYRTLSTVELQLLSDLGLLVQDADEERRTIEGTPEEERSPEEAVRRNQLERLLVHLTRAQERIGQSRRTLRRQQGERAARRASLGLSALKRAREQLRDPLQVLDGILPDARMLLQQSAVLAMDAFPGLDDERPAPPPWITGTSLGEESGEVRDRVTELADTFRSVAEREPPAPSPDDPRAAAQARMIENFRAALPHLDAASASFERSVTAFPEGRAAEGVVAVRDGVAALMRARELFLDAKGLVELLWQTENTVLRLLDPPDELGIPNDRESRLALFPEARLQHEENAARLLRLRTFIEDERAEVERARAMVDGEQNPNPSDPNAPAAPSAEELAAMEQRMTAVFFLLGEVERTVEAAEELFTTQSEGDETAIDLEATAAAVEHVLPPLEQLRRLYFTLVEHLRDLARRQVELNDRTADAIALARGNLDESDRHLLPHAPEQEQLAEIAGQLAPAIAAQAEQMGAAAPGAPPGGTTPDPQQAEQQENWRRAADLVASAQGEMNTAITALFRAHEPGRDVPFDEGSAAQRAALERLGEALALLRPPQDQQDSGEGSPPQDDENRTGDPQQEPDREPVDRAQLLQEVRDREAERRAEKQQRGNADRTVEKDW